MHKTITRDQNKFTQNIGLDRTEAFISQCLAHRGIFLQNGSI